MNRFFRNCMACAILLSEWQLNMISTLYLPLIKTFFPSFASRPFIPVVSSSDPSPNFTSPLQRIALVPNTAYAGHFGSFIHPASTPGSEFFPCISVHITSACSVKVGGSVVIGGSSRISVIQKCIYILLNFYIFHYLKISLRIFVYIL